MNWIHTHWKGIALCTAISIPAWIFGNFLPVVGGPVFAILMGMSLNIVIKDKSQMNAGISFTSKKILQYAVILLGFGMNLSVVASIGITSLPIIISTIGVSLLISFILYKAMKMPAKISTLIGVGSSICGGSAIAAAAPVIGADDEEIAQSISVVFLFNVIAALLFPTLGGWLGLSDYGFGLFAGTAINDTSSVTAAASAWDAIHGSDALNTATVVKLTRTLAIIPITLFLALLRTAKEKSQAKTKVNILKVFPTFILFFILASLITTICISFGVDVNLFAPLKTLSKLFIVLAMAAIGLHTDIKKLITKGGKPILLGLCCWIGIACVSLLMQHILHIW
jgi:uncharacterized integral membrane protein (TIGR00698 family)